MTDFTTRCFQPKVAKNVFFDSSHHLIKIRPIPYTLAQISVCHFDPNFFQNSDKTAFFSKEILALMLA